MVVRVGTRVARERRPRRNRGSEARISKVTCSETPERRPTRTSCFAEIPSNGREKYRAKCEPENRRSPKICERRDEREREREREGEHNREKEKNEIKTETEASHEAHPAPTQLAGKKWIRRAGEINYIAEYNCASFNASQTPDILYQPFTLNAS